MFAFDMQFLRFFLIVHVHHSINHKRSLCYLEFESERWLLHELLRLGHVR